MGLTILIIVLVLIVFLIAFLAVRLWMFQQPIETVEEIELEEVNVDRAAKHLGEAVRIATIAQWDASQTDPRPFAELRAKLEKMYPLIHKHLKMNLINGTSPVYTWAGKDGELAPVAFIAHLDVVPVDPAAGEWEHPPFSGEIADGFVWGRGTMDDKGSAISILEAVEHLLEQDYTPERTLIIALGCDEEVGGAQGAAKIVEWMQQQNIRLEAVLDEGGSIINGVLPGVEDPVALIGVTEKGVMNMELTVEDAPGHSSTPGKTTAIGILARAIARLEANPMPANLDSMQWIIQGVGPAAPFFMQLAFANLWLFGPFVRPQLEKNPKTNASIRTTMAATMIDGGVRENVLPARATAKLNFRLFPGDSIGDVCDHVRKVVKDERVQLRVMEGAAWEASAISQGDHEAYISLVRTVRQVFGNLPVSPYMMLGATDSRHYYQVCERVYRLTPCEMTADDMSRVHGTNERLSLEALESMVQFYVHLALAWGGAEM